MRYMSRFDSCILVLLPLLLMLLITSPLAANGQTQSQTLKGHWKGHIDIQGNKLFIKTHFWGDDSLHGTIDIPQQGAIGLSLQKISVSIDSVFFEFQAGPGLAQFKGMFRGDSAIVGSFHQRGRQFRFELERYEQETPQQRSNDKISTKSSEVLPDSELAGDWKGAIQANEPLLIKTHFKKKNGELKGTIEIQGVELPLQNIEEMDDDSVHFEFGSANGLATFKGSFTNDSSIAGNFIQNSFTFPFKLHRFTPDTVAKQATKTTLPYHQKDLIIKNDSITIGGTLTWPQEQSTETLVIMISGSGAQNRNEEILGFKPFFQIADSLTCNGIATFRYDDRGVGQSTGSFAQTSLDMLASDVEAIISEFSDANGQNFKEIILLGHSQGGIVAGKVATENGRVDKLILMASPGVSLAKTVVKQVKLLNKQQNIPDSVIAQNIKMQKSIFDTLRGSQDFTEIQDVLVKHDIKRYKNAPDSSQNSISNPGKFFRSKVKQELQYMQSPSYFSFLDYNPTNDLQKLDIPVLVLFGGKDTQVPVELNKAPIEKALEKADVQYKTRVFKNANHLFQKAKTGAVSEYGKLENEFVDGFTSTITQWIKD